ncbi:MAG: alpha/beta hydrolase [Sphingomonadales bacterium]|nr:alpha/beta hydrolase [Sphingomonadales bacterium]
MGTFGRVRAWHRSRARLSVSGDGAGANLATVVALMARDAAHDDIRLQLLVYPVIDLAMTSASYATYANGFGAGHLAILCFIKQRILIDRYLMISILT